MTGSSPGESQDLRAVASKGWDAALKFRSSALAPDVNCFQKVDLGRGRQRTNLRRITIEELQALQASWIQLIIYVLGQIGANVSFAETHARRPFTSDLVEVRRLQSVVPGITENRRQVQHRIRFAQSRSPNRPEGKNKRLTRVADPYFGQIERLIPRAVDSQRWIANQQAGVVLAQHL